ncbi:MAG: Fic family protein [Candidatus Cloacimonadaceae bacterium]|nr:Fic family protein [Candidatus Cloacimonadaceae bacterium]
MKFEEFKSGVYKKQYQYSSFLPAKINQVWTWEDPRVNVLLEQATQSLGELNAFSLIVPNVNLFIQMHILKEANTSSRIEGTNTEIEDVILDEDLVLPEKRDDWIEVQNYVNAINFAIEKLDTLPLSLRLIRETHSILMHSVRGENKTPGEFRRSQNWIGGSSLSDAAFIPPHIEDMPDMLGDFESFLHNVNINTPHLIKCAIMHYQFETIHPFLDGNGRIGRLLITLYLVRNRLLNKPTLYISDYFDSHRGAYYNALTRVRESHDLGHWVRFFLQSVIVTAEKGKTTFNRILELHRNTENEIVTLGRQASHARKLIIHMYQSPIITVKNAKLLLNLNYASVNHLISRLVEIGILREITGYARNRVFIFEKYVSVF